MGSKDPIWRKNLLYVVTILVKNINPTFYYIGWNQYLTTFPKFKIYSQRGAPWGDLNYPKATFEQQIILFLLCLIKYSEYFRIKYSQNNFENTFGSEYFIKNKTKLKLAKMVKKEPRKARFPWDLGLLFGNPMRYALISRFNIFKTKK